MVNLTDILPDIIIKYDEPMSNHTSFKIGGPVRAMVFPRSTDELVTTVKALQAAGEHFIVVGNGTNLLVAEQPLDLIAVKTPTGTEGLRLDDDMKIHAGSGVPLSKLAVFACENSLAGLEFAHGIPGSVGGAVFMNAGAYGGEISDFIKSVDVIMPDGSLLTLQCADCGFSYRHSVFSENGAVILSAVFELSLGNADEIRDKMRMLAESRREKQPINLPSAGSAFKRPPNDFAARLIDEAGLRGFRIGGAAVSEKHAGFIVNLGKASYNDVLGVINHVRETVLRKTGVELEPEIKIIGGGV